MKTILFFKNYFIILLILLLCSCSSWIKIATLNMVSTRNYESHANYVELQRYVEGYDDGKIIRKTGGGKYINNEGRITSAIEDAVRSVAGGEFMKNVEISANGERIKVRGDVWGLDANKNKNQFGHNIDIGDKVTFKIWGKVNKGEVLSVGIETATVQYKDENSQDKIKKFSYEELIKINNTDTKTLSQKSTTQQKINPKVSIQKPENDKRITNSYFPEFAIGDSVMWVQAFTKNVYRGEIKSFIKADAWVVFKDNKGLDRPKRMPLIKVKKCN